MSLPPQPPSSEQPEQPPVPHSPEETPTQHAPAADPLDEETKLSGKSSASEETPTLLSPPSDAHTEETEQTLVPSASEETPTVPISSSEPDEVTVSATDEDESDEDEDEDESDAFAQSDISLTPSARSGIFIPRKILIAVASIVVVVALLVATLVFVYLPKDPPTDWMTSLPPAAGSTGTSSTLYYLHWTNQNGELKGQLQLAANVNGTLQSLTGATTGLYNKDKHLIYVIITLNGQPNTLTGTVNDKNDTLTLSLAGATTPLLTFHTGSADDFKLATKKLGGKAAVGTT